MPTVNGIPVDALVFLLILFLINVVIWGYLYSKRGK
ncbi:hypothetical protein PP914_gp139 [Arthrobacter phage Qui]|uniref:Uncharacterized protein n=1 Tax=Arthrobacter phage Qui TaxID=2603260 RepID=A0A5B8WPL3_9CAUD|nr:hypothetical protein PP914_gp139 [Arthrobacter phage Qui]QED11628.1 hypothetical protein SEA_QUI_139 [Arthrobacter phage Qui]QOC56460.1 membrane protein [Arthrobacter phage Paella]